MTTGPGRTPDHVSHQRTGPERVWRKSMPEETELSEIIGEIYDAALDPAMWPVVIGRVVAFCKGQAGCIIIRDLARQTSRIEYSAGFPARYFRVNIHRYFRLPSLEAILSSADMGEVIRISDLLGAERFGRARFYRNWLRPHGWSDLLLVPVSTSKGNHVIIAMARRDRPAAGQDPIRLVAPHLEQALKISRPLVTTETQATSFAATLDGFKPGIFLLDRKGNLVQANSSGETMLKEARILHIFGGDLRFRDMAADQLIRGAIAASHEGRPGDRPSAVDTQMILQNGDRYIARLLPLEGSTQQSDGVRLNAVLALFIYQAELETASPLRFIAETYDLTPAEMRVFLAVVQIGGVPEAAEVLGIARNTTRVLLQRVYNKTGVNRQAELAKLLASFSTPLVH